MAAMDYSTAALKDVIQAYIWISESSLTSEDNFFLIMKRSVEKMIFQGNLQPTICMDVTIDNPGCRADVLA